MKFSLKSNIRKLNTMKFFKSSLIAMPVMTLFFQDNWLSLSQIFILQSIFAIAMFAFEVPTWYFGDNIGKKKSIILGTIIASIWFFLYAWWDGFMDFAVSEIILALWVAFVSWSDSALLYDTMKELDQSDRYKVMEGRSLFISEFSAALGWIAGGFVASHYGLQPVMFVQAIIVALAIPFALTLIDVHSEQQNPDINLRKKMWSVVTLALYGNKKLKWIIIYTSILSTATLIMIRAYQPYLAQINVPLARLGIIRFAFRSLVALSWLFAHRRDKALWYKRSLLSLLWLSTLWFVISGFTASMSTWFIAIGIWLSWLLLFQVARGLQKPISTHAIQELITSDIRATVLSVNSMMGRLCYAILWPLIGRVWDLYNMSTMFFFSAWLFAIIWLLSFYRLFKAH